MFQNINQIIKERRSHYPTEYTGEAIEQEVIQLLIENANYAPNHHLNYPWRFVVINKNKVADFVQVYIDLLFHQNPDLESSDKKIEKLKLFQKNIGAVIGIVHHKVDSKLHHEDQLAIACAVQNMYLSLSQFESIGGYWSTGMAYQSNEMNAFFKLSKEQELMGYFVLGKLENKRTESNRKDVNQFISYL
jgi:nitroreductase